MFNNLKKLVQTAVEIIDDIENVTQNNEHIKNSHSNPKPSINLYQNRQNYKKTSLTEENLNNKLDVDFTNSKSNKNFSSCLNKDGNLSCNTLKESCSITNEKSNYLNQFINHEKSLYNISKINIEPNVQTFDLSHLSSEEKEIIESVIKRAQQEELANKTKEQRCVKISGNMPFSVFENAEQHLIENKLKPSQKNPDKCIMCGSIEIKSNRNNLCFICQNEICDKCSVLSSINQINKSIICVLCRKCDSNQKDFSIAKSNYEYDNVEIKSILDSNVISIKNLDNSMMVESNDYQTFDNYHQINDCKNHNIILEKELCINNVTDINYKELLNEEYIKRDSINKIKRRLPSTPSELEKLDNPYKMSSMLNINNSNSPSSSNLSIPVINNQNSKSVENVSITLKPKLENVTEWLNKSFDHAKIDLNNNSKPSSLLQIQKQQRSNSMAHVRVVPDEPLVEINLNKNFYSSKTSDLNSEIETDINKKECLANKEDKKTNSLELISNKSLRNKGEDEDEEELDREVCLNLNTAQKIEKNFENNLKLRKDSSINNSRKLLTKQNNLNYLNENEDLEPIYKISSKNFSNTQIDKHGEGRGFRELSIKRKDILTTNRDVVITDPAFLYAHRNEKNNKNFNQFSTSHKNSIKSSQDSDNSDFNKNTVLYTRASSQPPSSPINKNFNQNDATNLNQNTSSKVETLNENLSKNINLARFRSSSPYRKNSLISNSESGLLTNIVQSDIKIKINNNETEYNNRKESNKSNSNDTGFSSLIERVSNGNQDYEYNSNSNNNQLIRQLSESSSHSNSNKDDSDSVYSFNSNGREINRKYSVNTNENKNLLNLPEHNFAHLNSSDTQINLSIETKQSNKIADNDTSSSPFGDLQIQLSHNEEDQQITVKIIKARNLIAKDANGYSDPFVKVYLLPGREQENKRRTKHVLKNLNPEWNCTVVYPNVHKEELKYKTLEFTIWDWDRFKSNDFLGIVKVELNDLSCLDNKPTWYQIKNPTFNLDNNVQDWSNCKDSKSRSPSVKRKSLKGKKK